MCAHVYNVALPAATQKEMWLLVSDWLVTPGLLFAEASWASKD